MLLEWHHLNCSYDIINIPKDLILEKIVVAEPQNSSGMKSFLKKELENLPKGSQVSNSS
jgi:hypothetical protein